MTELHMNLKRGSFKKFLAGFLVFCLCFTAWNLPTIVSASGSNGTGISDPEVTPTEVTVFEGSAAVQEVTLTPSQAKAYSVKVSPTEAKITKVAATNTNVSVVTTTEGQVKVEAKGSAGTSADVTVTAKASGYLEGTYTFKVMIAEKTAGGTDPGTSDGGEDGDTDEPDDTPEPEKTPPAVTSVSLDEDELELQKTETAELTATVEAEDGADKTVTWETSNAEVAIVDGGKVTALAVGTATITAKAGNETDTCTVTVRAASIKLNATKMPLEKGKKTTALEIAKKSLETDTIASVTSSNDSVVKASANGKGVITVTAGKKAAGKKADVTITMKSGASAKCTVTVQKGAVKTTKLTFDKKKLTLEKGKKATLEVTRNPISASDKITWSTSDSKVVTVKNGKLTAKGTGTATITAKANGKKATCKVTVAELKLSKTSINVKVGQKVTIKVKSQYPKKEKLTYKSKDPSIATVTKKGVVQGKKKGTTTITVTSKSGVTATLKVKVKGK